jgi:hypothetical protein
MQSKKDSTETKTKKRAKKTRNNKDSALLHFMFIRDEITSLPRPPRGLLNKELDNDQAGPLIEQVKPTSPQRRHEELVEERKLNDRLIGVLQAYELAIQEIDRISLHAISTIYDVQVGGRNPKLAITKLAETIAISHFHKNKKLPTGKELHSSVRKDFFKNDPQKFIRIVSQENEMDPSEVLQNSRAPSWDYWKLVPGLTSERAMSKVLTQLRIKIKNNSPK